MARDDDVLDRLAAAAAQVGPAIVPEGHHELLRSITDAAMDLFAAAACSLALVDDDELVFLVASGEGAEQITGQRVSIGSGIAGWVVASGQPISISDVQRDQRFAKDVAQATGYVPRSILAMPLETERRTVGVIEVLDRDVDGRDTANDMRLLSLFARQAALAIENSMVFTDLGRAMLAAIARASEDSDVSDALLAAAENAELPDPDLARLTAHIADISRLGPRARAAAIDLMAAFLSYARKR
ncbi:MAG: GAF domain-containing protein [Actinomycetota bacterium]